MHQTWVRYQRKKNIAFVEITKLPNQQYGLQVRKELANAIDWVESQTTIQRVILFGHRNAFAYSDWNQTQQLFLAPQLSELIAKIEVSEVPWIAAVDGIALGNGAELILGCHYRVFSPKSKVGFPEVTLGLVPSAGATQRLPRLIGLSAALKLITTGKPLLAASALKLGLVDKLTENPVESASQLALSAIENHQPLPVRENPNYQSDLFLTFQNQVKSKSFSPIAASKAIKLIESSCSVDLDEGIKLEKEALASLQDSKQTLALQHVFFAQNQAQQGVHFPEEKFVELTKVAVVGGGLMGSGIAYSLLNAGLQVVVIEVGESSVRAAKANVNRLFKSSLNRKLIDRFKAERMRKSLQFSTTLHNLQDCQLAIEAVFEDLAIKQQVFLSLNQNLPKDAILATNTSYLNINKIAHCVDNPTRVLGLHFFAPAHIMKLVEVIKGDDSSRQALATGFAVAKMLKKIPVLADVCDGFIGNRILTRYRAAAEILLMSGALPWQIDQAMVEFGYAMGPFEVQDISGLHIAYANRQQQKATDAKKHFDFSISDQMVVSGRTGRKIGLGWYRYSEGQPKSKDPQVEQIIIKESKSKGIDRLDYSNLEISHRLLLAMINEAADILWEGIAPGGSSDIDLVSIFGYGFPRWRGGLMYYGDELTPALVLRELTKLAQEDGNFWKPSPLIVECVERGCRFSEFDLSEKSINKFTS